MQIAIHAIGDRANDEVSALYQSLLTRKSSSSNTTDAISSVTLRKHRVEHVQHLSGPQALQALREADAVAVTNPLHLLSDLDIIEARLGKGRAKPGLAFPSKALLQVCCTAVAAAGLLAMFDQPVSICTCCQGVELATSSCSCQGCS